MRSILATMVGVAFVFSAACGSTNHGTTTGSGSGSGTTTGATGGIGDQGSPCHTNNDCNSKICNAGLDGPGLCCANTCNSDSNDICAQPIGCTDAGACAYPPDKTVCGSICTENDTESSQEQCSNHICVGGAVTDCAPYSCTGTACNTACTVDGGQCAPDNYCVAGACVKQTTFGPCASDAQCNSGHCGTNNLCCAVQCPPSSNDTTDCNAAGCTYDAGACEYPVGHACIAEDTQHLCTGDNTLLFGQCNFTGFCEMDAGPCPGHLACDEKGDGCAGPQCRVASDCATGFYCKGQICIPQQVDGGCSNDDQCLSEHCGVSDTTGHCCPDVGCIPASDGGLCGATDCDGTTAACNYPDNTVACGTPQSCNPNTEIQRNASLCNQAGLCLDLGSTPCAPYICNLTTGCFTSCTDVSSCASGDFCDTVGKQCCSALTTKGTLNVDSVNGIDNGCCGLPTSKNACATITYAMKMIDSAQAQNVIIKAAVKAAGGDWAPAGEVYPIVLGWGAEVNAPGVAFLDPKAAGAEIFDIKAYSANDTLAYASIVGTQAANAIVGYNTVNTVQTTDPSSILVETGSTLYLAGVDVNGSAAGKTTAISIQAGGTLTVGGDAPAINELPSGTVTVGTRAGKNIDGWNGIVCGAGSASSQCTLNDVSVKGGSSLRILNQEHVDLEADDYASVTLTSAPVFGLPPAVAGFSQCTTKNDGKGDTGYGVLLDGKATVTLDNATVACIASPGIYLESTPNGTPTLTLEDSTVENTELGLYVGDGAATVSGTTFEFNYNGVEQAGSGTVDLNGGATSGNTVVCDSNKETTTATAVPGVGVNDANGTGLDASNTSWDTKGPDVFTCTGALATTCSCDIATCTQIAGHDDMDAVETSTGVITTTNGTQSTIATANNCG